MGEIMEALMVVCFGLSWPISVVKAYKSKSSKGKSLAFSVIILMGYFCGIAGKIATNRINYVFVFYIINVIFVLIDIALNLRNRRYERAGSWMEEETGVCRPLIQSR